MASFVFNRVGGGGGTSLNFKVVASTTQPSNPVTNTIWVNTSDEMTSWVFSSDTPNVPTAGMVWFKVSDNPSTISFNALPGTNILMIYPISVSQYVSGAWVTKSAKTYNGSAWVDWATYIYKDGDQYTAVTGGWKKGGYCTPTGDGGYNTGSTFTLEESDMRLYSGPSTSGGLAQTIGSIDLTNISTICMKVTDFTLANSTKAYGCFLMATSNSSNKWNPNATTYQALPAGAVVSQAFSSTGIVMLDVSSLSGNYYIAFSAAGRASVTVKVSEVYYI